MRTFSLEWEESIIFVTPHYSEQFKAIDSKKQKPKDTLTLTLQETLFSTGNSNKGRLKTLTWKQNELFICEDHIRLFLIRDNKLFKTNLISILFFKGGDNSPSFIR